MKRNLLIDFTKKEFTERARHWGFYTSYSGKTQTMYVRHATQEALDQRYDRFIPINGMAFKVVISK